MIVNKWMEQSIIVKGYLRSAIYDLNRLKLHLVDKRIDEVIEKAEGVSREQFLEKADSTEIEWFNHLTELELLQPVPSICFENFTPLSINWESPKLIIETYLHEDNNIKECIKLLRLVDCRNIILIVEDDSSLDMLMNDHFRQTDLFSLDIFIKKINLPDKYYKDLISKYPIINKLHFNKTLDNSNNQAPSKIEYSLPIHYLTIGSFLEAQEHNLFFNKTLFIDKNGCISNTITSEKSELNINQLNSKNIRRQVENSDVLQKYWEAKKDNTDVCKECEFRYQCLDARIPEKRESDDMWFHKKECEYNPFIGKWKGEDHYVPLKEIGVLTNNSGYKIDESKIEAANHIIWGN